MEKTHGETAMHAAHGRIESHMTMSTGNPDWRDTDREDRLSELADRAGSLFGETLDTVGDRAREAADFVDEHTGAITLVRGNPLAAVGIAFAAGIVIAAISRPSERRSVVERARLQLRTALLSGLSALATRELPALLGDGDLANLVQSFVGGPAEYADDSDYDDGEEDEDEDYYDA
jgi:ElaB/YqjD/DUF883 family membrane-anchored ribosome-binding protein